MDDNWSRVWRIGIGRFPDEAKDWQRVLRDSVIGPSSVVVLPNDSLSHVDAILPLLYLLVSRGDLPLVSLANVLKSTLKILTVSMSQWSLELHQPLDDELEGFGWCTSP